MHLRSWTVLGAFALVAGLAAPAWSDPPSPIPVPITGLSPAPVIGDNPGPGSDTAAAGQELLGLFEIRKGVCGSGATDVVTSGSYFRMVQPNGNPQAGPFVDNNDSPCGSKSFTPLSPGSDSGIVTALYQPHPNPAFDTLGNGLNGKITQPQAFFGTKFSTATNQTDPQTGSAASPPKITLDGSSLSGDFRSFAAAWNNQHFNQGSPKPDSSKPGNTSGPTGTLNTTTQAFTLDWTSHIVGGPFNGFTGKWHFEGTFKSGITPPGAQAAQTSQGRASGGGGRSLASTGAEVPTRLGLLLLILAAAVFAADRVWGRLNRLRS